MFQSPKSLSLFTVSVLLAASATGQVPIWTARFNATAPADDRTNSIVVDREQNAYYIGTNDAGWEVRKVSPAGAILWHWHGSGLYTNAYARTPKGIGFDGAGNLHILGSGEFARLSPDGQTFSIHRFDFPGAPANIALTPSGEIYAVGSRESQEGGYDAYIAKYSVEGLMLWERSYDSPWHADDGVSALAIGPSGDLWAAGSAGSYTWMRNTGYAFLILRYSADGDLIWDRVFEIDPANPVERLNASDIAVDSAGNAFVTGSNSTDSENPLILTVKLRPDGSPDWFDTGIAHDGRDSQNRLPRVLLDETHDAVFVVAQQHIADTSAHILLIGYQRAGKREWLATFDDHPGARAYVREATIDGRGTIHLLGTEYGPGDERAYLLVQYSGDGQLTSVVRHPYDSPSYGSFVSGAVDGDGNAFIAVSAFNDFADSRALRFGADGTLQWSQLFSTTVGSEEEFIDAALTAEGGLYLIGRSNRRVPGNGNVIQRYSANGNLEWEQRLPNDCLLTIGAILADESGNAVIVGTPAAENHYRVGLAKYSPTGQPLWFGGYFGALSVEGLTQRVGMDAQGSVLVCGTLEHHYNFDSYDFEGTLVSFSPTGALLWERAVNGNGYHTFDALAVDAEGGVVAAGTIRLSGLIPDILVVRLAADGQELWRRQFVHPDSERRTNVVAVRLLPDGTACVLVNELESPDGSHKVAVLLVGATGELRGMSDIAIDSGSNSFSRNIVVTSSNDIFVLSSIWNLYEPDRLALTRIDANGVIHWTKVLSGITVVGEWARFVRQLAGGDLLISSDSHDPDTYESLILLRRVDLDGNVRWMSTHWASSELSGGSSRILATADGGFISAGGAFSAETRGDFAAIRYAPPPLPCGTIDPCRGDANGDCVVDLSDLVTVLAQFGGAPAVGFAPADGDVDLDTNVDIQDLSEVLSAMGANCR